MIVKKILSQTSGKAASDTATSTTAASSKSSYITALTRYITDSLSSGQSNGKSGVSAFPGRVAYVGARGFLSEVLEEQKAEMIALAHCAVRSSQPVSHWMLSWREGEQPSVAHVEECVTIFLGELGLAGHQVIYALHGAGSMDQDIDPGDKDGGVTSPMEGNGGTSQVPTSSPNSQAIEHGHNIHLHLAVSRVHPLTQKVIKPGGGRDIEAAHRAIARMEHLHGWQREENGRYELTPRGQMIRSDPGAFDTRQPGQLQSDQEHRTGVMSAQRLAIESAAPLIRRVKSWEMLHKVLRDHGFQYIKTGSGAVIKVGDVHVKASNADRKASLAQLQKRLGPYVADTNTAPVPMRAVVPMRPTSSGWNRYLELRSAHFSAKKAAQAELSETLTTQRKALREEQFLERKRVLSGAWKSLGQSLNALRSVLAADQARHNAALKDEHQRLRESLRMKFPPFPNYEMWLRHQGMDEEAEEWRYRSSMPGCLSGTDSTPPKPRDIRAYHAHVVGSTVHYYHQDSSSGATSFLDRGNQVVVLDVSEQSILAAMQVSQQKFGSFCIEGIAEFVQTCIKLAAEHGFHVTNPELQVRLDIEREQVKEQRMAAARRRYTAAVSNAMPPPPEQLQLNSPPVLPMGHPVMGCSIATSPVETRTLQARRAKHNIPTRLAESTSAWAKTYGQFFLEVMEEFGSQKVDLSRVDALIALRMRITQFSRTEIQSAVEQCAPLIRVQPEQRQWRGYAAHAARYAWSGGARLRMDSNPLKQIPHTPIHGTEMATHSGSESRSSHTHPAKRPKAR